VPAKSHLRFLLTALFLSVATASSAPAAPLQILAYETQDRDSSQALRSRFAFFNQLATDCFHFTREGKITGRLPAADVAFARAQKMQTFATVSNYAGTDFSADLAHALITSPTATRTFLAGAEKILATGKYTGLNLDIESITAKDRAAYSTFVQTTADDLRKAGYLTVVSVPAAAKDDPDNSWTGAFDVKALGASADLLQVMTYDENGTWGPAGPIAGLDWVEAAIRFTASVVPPEKISLGLPAFAYNWDLDDSHKNSQPTWATVPALLAKVHGEAHWDDASSSPNFTYIEAGHHHIVWHENEKSIALKAHLAVTYHLAGVSVWCLGQEDDTFWQAVHSALQ
jgi:spore germination protein